MKRFRAFEFLLGLALAAFSATAAPAVIPVPEDMAVRDGVFHLRPDTSILADAAGKATGEFLAERLRVGMGYAFKVAGPSGAAPLGNIQLTTNDADPALGAEGYELNVAPEAVTLRAGTQAGLFYGEMTLLQLLPPEIFSPRPRPNADWSIPCVSIKDQPRFAWRGLMLDVSRHFLNKTEVETILDTMALYKLNTFHFHLVDDQGWRIEIKKYPRLTSVGAWRDNIGWKLDPKSSKAWRADGKYGGFYTQKDIRELVRYAAARHITIVPEIEMPGHSAGALGPYPQYSCTGAPGITDKTDNIFCPGNEQTYVFLENILSEVIKLFPGQFIHVGGDEVSTRYWKKCPKCQALMKAEGLHDEKQLEGYLLRRIEKYLNAHGKRLIGWSEIREAGLPEHAAVMDWIGGASEAAVAGHDVVMSPAIPHDYCYFDHYQSRDRASEPKAIGGFLPLSQVYSFEPVPAKLAPQFASHILGGQGNLWAEYVPNLSHAEYMIFPRELAIAEVMWSPKESRNWDDFLARVKFNERRLDALGINDRRDPTKTGEARK